MIYSGGLFRIIKPLASPERLAGEKEVIDVYHFKIDTPI